MESVARPVSADEGRRERLRQLPRRRELENLIDESAGYAWLPAGLFPALPASLDFARKVFDEKNADAVLDARPFRGADLLTGTKYEDAPPFFDLALSDELLQLAADYLGEIPVLMRPRLWLTKPQQPGTELGGTQLFHRGRPDARQIQRQAKFLVTMSDVDECSGPFTFLPAGISEKVLPGYRMGDRISDEEMYRLVDPAQTIQFTGPAGAGLMVDTMRCFHYGRRVSSKERLMLMIQFMKHFDAVEEDRVERSEGFLEKFGASPLHQLVIPEW